MNENATNRKHRATKASAISTVLSAPPKGQYTTGREPVQGNHVGQVRRVAITGSACSLTAPVPFSAKQCAAPAGADHANRVASTQPAGAAFFASERASERACSTRRRIPHFAYAAGYFDNEVAA